MPLANLWAELVNQKLDGDPGALIPVTDVLDVIQRSIVLLGNANNLISKTRREVILESIQPSFKKYAKGDFSEASSDLFGVKFKETLVQQVEADTALSKAVHIATRGSRVYQNPARQEKSKRPLYPSRTSGYGAVFGRRYTPYQPQNTYNQRRGKYAPGKSYYAKKGSVFERLSHTQDKPRPSQ